MRRLGTVTIGNPTSMKWVGLRIQKPHKLTLQLTCLPFAIEGRVGMDFQIEDGMDF
jgi:hypothetical protein